MSTLTPLRAAGSALGAPGVKTGAPAPVDGCEVGSDRLIVSVVAAPPLVHEGVRELLRGSSFDVVPEVRFAGGAIALLDPTIVDARVPLDRAVAVLGRRFQHVVLFPMSVDPSDGDRASQVGASGIISQTARGFALRNGLDQIMTGRSVVIPTESPRPASQ